MAREIVIGHNSAGQVGIFVAPPGVDAYTAQEWQLRFSPQRRHLMLVQSGSVQLGGIGIDVWTPFVRPLNSAPLVLCGVFNPKPIEKPVGTVATTTGFWARALQPIGLGGAAGEVVPYYAYLKSQT